MNITFSSCDVSLPKRSLSYGTSVTGDTTQALGAEEDQRMPRGKRASRNGNQPLSEQQRLTILKFTKMERAILIGHQGCLQKIGRKWILTTHSPIFLQNHPRILSLHK
ncbi:hypothetical protein [Fictibacillus solisalsi]|uniref:hypothetical protein n=1 Tax=Fictibacillus solisalsi TaxID=459525 RepID=UPI0011140D6A|nr:hypothetical protein [Fictibacillus solisalsi]